MDRVDVRRTRQTLGFIRCTEAFERFLNALACIPGREAADGGPIEMLATLGQQPQKSVVEQATQRHRHAPVLASRAPSSTSGRSFRGSLVIRIVARVP